ncbi:hypothetical protein [Streptomyces sp. NPDC050388]
MTTQLSEVQGLMRAHLGRALDALADAEIAALGAALPALGALDRELRAGR